MVSLFFSLSVKSVFAMLTLPRGSAHEIEFAVQIPKKREHISLYFDIRREKVSAWELPDDFGTRGAFLLAGGTVVPPAVANRGGFMPVWRIP